MFRRSEPRLPPTSSALIIAEGAEQTCEILDLSERGARLAISGPLQWNSFELALARRAPPRAAHVRWRRGNEVGVQFLARREGDVIPGIHLAMADPPHTALNIEQLVTEGRVVVVGVVGAFAPERLQIHLTEVHRKAMDLHRAGFARLICIAPNDPWTVKAWARVVDPERRLMFLCDGNLEFARWLGATFTTSKRRHLGVRPRSYLALLRSGTIERLTFDGLASALVSDEAREQEGGDRLPPTAHAAAGSAT